ncbi:hypothetical protein BKA67DRAFT_690990 [Truncatella angustata]|uniref:Uncharacterized protein n=1 Tax=Truncatella angustata TaxID=152316 RepID=A0A9P8UKZ2_9PEZI|nr:uncharacterized protein BKA67DRAFT_690990 [Truncatella angustata]KAH6653887.1 hypothetical protein BKA67DRAFT_690990 [Truncatella angustata]
MSNKQNITSENSSADPLGEDDSGAVYLKDIAHSKTLQLGLRANYAPWEPWQARDGIIRALDLAEADFEVVRDDKSQRGQDEIIYKLARPGSNPKEWLAYIRYTNKCGAGSVEIVSPQAAIEPWHLDLGGTTKQGVSNQAGQHGDGLNLALLAFLKKPRNLALRCLTGGFHWNFTFDTAGKLVARLYRHLGNEVHKVIVRPEASFRSGLIPFVPHSSQDVIFVIGKEFLVRDKVDKNKLVPARVDLGDVLVGASLIGNIYLKGLLLKESACAGRYRSSASMTGKPLVFGYNFGEGNTNRDRQFVVNAREESEKIQDVWTEVLRQHGNATVDIMHEMLNCEWPECADEIEAGTSTTLVQRRMSIRGSLRSSVALAVKGFDSKGLTNASFIAKHHQDGRAGAVKALSCCPRKLGLSPDARVSMVVLYTAKHLFGDVVDQMAADVFPETESNGRKKSKEQERIQVEQRMYDCCRIQQGLTIDALSNFPRSKLVVDWNLSVGWGVNEDILVQVHRMSTCEHGFKAPLLARDVMSQICCPQVVAKVSQGSVSIDSVDLMAGEKYFATVVPTQDMAFVVTITKNICTMMAPGLRPLPRNERYTPGSQLRHLDIMEPRDWYDAQGETGRKGVIGPPRAQGVKRSNAKSPSGLLPLAKRQKS